MAETEKTAAATTNTSTSDSTTSSHKSVDVDEAGVPMMTPLQKKLFELRRKGVKASTKQNKTHISFFFFNQQNEAKKRTRDQLIEEETKKKWKWGGRDE